MGGNTLASDDNPKKESKIFLDVDLTRSYVAELKRSKALVAIA